jgi:hexosaminidase
LQGSDVFGDGNWQGFEGDDLEAVIDLGEVIPIKTIRLNFLSDPKSWIFLPRSVEIRISADGENYRPVERFDNFHALSNQASQAPKAIVPLRANCFERARYISIRARNLGTCPPGHPGAGSKAWMFTDEIIVD